MKLCSPYCSLSHSDGNDVSPGCVCVQLIDYPSAGRSIEIFRLESLDSKVGRAIVTLCNA